MPAAARHTCPTCGREAPVARDGDPPPAPGVAPIPFCTPACKLADLGRWLDGSYRIPGPAVESSLDTGRDGDDE